MKAILKNYRQSPRKVRLVTTSLCGKKVTSALEKLLFTPKRSSLPIRKLIESAVANAKQAEGLDINDLFIKTITVNEGYTLKRWRPRARGAAFPINKRTSLVTVELIGAEGAKKSKISKKKTSKTAKIKKLSDKSVPKAPKREGSGRSAIPKASTQRTTNK